MIKEAENKAKKRHLYDIVDKVYNILDKIPFKKKGK